jgi:hypothetical protein
MVNKMRKFKALLWALSLGTSLQVLAIPTLSITGELGMIGAFKPVDSSGTETSISTATGIDFNPNQFKVASVTGSFSSIAIGTIGDIKDVQFDLFSGPIDDFWTIGDFGFELTSISKGFTSDPENKLVLEGVGVISAAGYLDTQGTWTFTGQTTSVGGVFTWSAGTAAEVSEPGILALLGIGLIGLAVRKKTIIRS